MIRRLQFLVCGSLLFLALVSYPALRLWGATAIVYASVGMGLCLLPTIVTLAWSAWALKSSAEQQLLLVLGGTGLRMTFVLGAGLMLYGLVEYFHRESFWLWVLVAYLFTLALEIALMLVGRSAAGGEERADSLAKT